LRWLFRCGAYFYLVPYGCLFTRMPIAFTSPVWAVAFRANVGGPPNRLVGRFGL
jgi:hypothetical protein